MIVLVLGLFLLCMLANAFAIGSVYASYVTQNTHGSNSFSTTAITPPTNLQGSNVLSVVSISWTASTNGNKYNVYFLDNGASSSCPSAPGGYTLASGMPTSSLSYSETRGYSLLGYFCYAVETVAGSWTSLSVPAISVRGVLSILGSAPGNGIAPDGSDQIISTESITPTVTVEPTASVTPEETPDATISPEATVTATVTIEPTEPITETDVEGTPTTGINPNVTAPPDATATPTPTDTGDTGANPSPAPSTTPDIAPTVVVTPTPTVRVGAGTKAPKPGPGIPTAPAPQSISSPTPTPTPNQNPKK